MRESKESGFCVWKLASISAQRLPCMSEWGFGVFHRLGSTRKIHSAGVMRRKFGEGRPSAACNLVSARHRLELRWGAHGLQTSGVEAMLTAPTD